MLRRRPPPNGRRRFTCRRRSPLLPYLVLACRIMVGGVLLYAAAGKVRHRTAFAAFTVSVRRLSGVPARLAGPVAAGVVATELALGGALLVGVRPVVTFSAAAALLLAFTAVLVRAMRRPAAASCGCLGAGTEPVSWRHVVRNVALLAVTAVGTAGTATGDAAPINPAGAAFSVAGALFAVLMIVMLDDLAAVFRMSGRCGGSTRHERAAGRTGWHDRGGGRRVRDGPRPRTHVRSG
ncbi:MauE/DoxX family redox-associated membrane protein [Plantactinospora sp. B6F1]|uniref:MauE/DoxX family redox-associated membrane protein n=1 Tax=Plantactinospora sp. B6F1 TaxID=3158971 RepID=UPI00102CB589